MSIPRYDLYGETSSLRRDGFVHLESLEERSRPSNWNIRPHIHGDLHQIFLVRSGAGRIFLDDRDGEVPAPLMVMAPAGVVHAFNWMPGSEGKVLTIADAVYRAVVHQHPELEGLFDRARWCDLAQHSEAVDRLSATLDELLGELVWEGPFQSALIFSRVTVALALTGRVISDLGEAPRSYPGGDRKLVDQFRQRLEAGFRVSESIPDYAAALGVSEKRLRAACLLIVGETPLQLLRRRRLLEAKRLLVYSAMTVREIGYAIGLEDPAYFSRFFSAEVGAPPGVFRQRSRAKANANVLAPAIGPDHGGHVLGVISLPQDHRTTKCSGL